MTEHDEGKKSETPRITHITLTINGDEQVLRVGSDPGEVAPWHTLSYTLRETLGLTGTKVGCDRGACGACTVIMNGKPVPSCMMLTVECDGNQIETIEGLRDPHTGGLHPIQEAFVENTAFQCGFCTPGIIMSSKALLEKESTPTENKVKDALAGHFCRCISHYHVVEAVLKAAGKGR